MTAYDALCGPGEDEEQDEPSEDEVDDRTSPEKFEDAIDNAIYPDDEEDD